MLSPLIMYKPNTSCWTPSCKFQLRINRKNDMKGSNYMIFTDEEKDKEEKGSNKDNEVVYKYID